MGRLENLPEETWALIFTILQEDELGHTKRERKHDAKGLVLSQSTLRARLVCKKFRQCVDFAGIRAVVTKTTSMASLFSRLEAKMQVTTSAPRPFGMVRMIFAYVSSHTACLDALFSSHGSRCVPYLSELCVHQRLFLCPNFVVHYGDMFGIKKLSMRTIEMIPKGVIYPFDVGSLSLPETPPGQHPPSYVRGLVYNAHTSQRSLSKPWGKTLFGQCTKARTIIPKTLVYLVGRTRTWCNNPSGRDYLPSHVLRAGRYVLSEGPHSKKDSPCFLRTPFVLIQPSIELGVNFISVSEIKEVHLCYIDIGCIKTFMAYFSGLKRVVLGERVLGRNTVEKNFADNYPHVSVINKFRHV